MLFRTTVTFLLALLLTTTAWAGIQPGTFTLSPMFGGHIFDDEQNLEDSSLWSVGLGFNLTDRAALEAVYSRTDADADAAASSDAKVQSYRLDALYHFRPQQQLVPYLAVGLGEIIIDPNSGSNSEHLLANVGGGLKFFLNDFVAIRADVRYLLDFPEPEDNFLYSAGLVFQLGTPDVVPDPVVIAEPVPLLDSDSDGVMNDRDKCAETPAGAKVNSIGCPIDSDSDGIPDYRDNCPNTPTNAAIDSNGCPLDTDDDGVFDYQDQCPNTPAGISVDAVGCTSKLTLRINFGLDSEQIGPDFDGEISKAAQCINNFPGNTVFIDGHTDDLGPAAYNQKLSERRAKAVKNRLIEKFAIPANRLSSRGFGETMPVADNSTEDGLFQNRRVEVACGATE